MRAHFRLLVLLLLCGAASTVRSPAEEASPGTGADIAEVHGRFLNYARSQGLPAETLAKVEARIAAAKGEKGARDAVAACLTLMNQKLAEAVSALLREDWDKADRLLAPLCAEKDEWVAANAALLRAHCLTEQERCEDALPLLQKLTETKPAMLDCMDEATYLQGFCQARMMKLDEATVSLKKLLLLYPDSPEELRQEAVKLLVRIALAKNVKLAEARELMNWSRRRLKLTDPGKETQVQQEKILGILDEIVKKMEQQQQQQQQQQQSQGQSQGQGQGQSQGGQPGSPQGQSPGGAKESSLAQGSTSMGSDARVNRGSAADSWGNMPQKERDKVLSSLAEKFPGRYKDLVEQYYKSLQEDEQ